MLLTRWRHSVGGSAPFCLIPIRLTWTKLLLTDVLNASWRNARRNPDPNPNPNPHSNPNNRIRRNGKTPRWLGVRAHAPTSSRRRRHEKVDSAMHDARLYSYLFALVDWQDWQTDNISSTKVVKWIEATKEDNSTAYLLQLKVEY